MIIRARSVVTMDGPPIENGAVVIDGEKIVAVGPWDEAKRAAAGEVIDLGESILFPGLINAHCHLDYTLLRGKIPRQASFSDWIRAINTQKAALTSTDYLCSIAAGFVEAAEFGTTTLANLEAFPALLAQMPAPPLRTWWFAEMIDARAAVSVAEVYEQLRLGFDPSAGWIGGLGLAPHAPFTASRKLYAEAAAMARRQGLALTTHLAESREEMEMFRDRRGPLHDLMASVRRQVEESEEATPLAFLLKHGLLDERWIVAHLNELTSDDLQLLADGPRFHVVHSPRSHAYFGHSPFQTNALRALGFNICLGTDSLASNDDLSLFAEMRQYADGAPDLAPQEILKLTTVNAAAALGQAGSLGQLRAGAFADLIAVPFKSGDVFRQILAHEEKVQWMMVNGRRIARMS